MLVLTACAGVTRPTEAANEPLTQALAAQATTMPSTEPVTIAEEWTTGQLEFVPVFTAKPLSEHIIELITGSTFHDNTPFDYDFLSLLTLTHIDFDGHYQIGQMIVAAEIAYEVLDIFEEIFEARFPIHSILLIDYFGADDYLSLEANNSSAFNFRYIAGTNMISRHGFGMAIDINPVQNPYYRHGIIKPAIGADYLDRENVRPGMITPGDAVYTAFVNRGWIWGGNWTSPRDYHHFERR